MLIECQLTQSNHMTNKINRKFHLGLITINDVAIFLFSEIEKTTSLCFVFVVFNDLKAQCCFMGH